MRLTIVALAVAACGVCCADAPKTLKACVFQPPYALDMADVDKSMQWEFDTLKKCDPSLDLIVLPEASDRQGRPRSREESIEAAKKYNAPLLAACAETAKRCGATVFVNALDFSHPSPRNTTFAFDKTGACVGKYDKEHLTAGEWKKYKFDESYMWKWSEPKILEIDGVRYAFLTCYDFYFYENFANIARLKPDVIIGCSHQRSDPHSVLEMIGKFLTYNTGAYLVRSSVSMGLDSPVGGGSMVVAPSGEMLGNMFSRVGTLTVEFDPHAKYLKPMGYGNPPGLHSTYIEVGRRPWKYRPAGSAIIPGFKDAETALPKRLCAHRGFSTVAPENSLPAFGSAVALGATEIEFDLWWTKDGEIVSIHDATLDRVSDGKGKVYEHTYEELAKLDFGSKFGEKKGLKNFAGLRILRFEEILAKLSCHTIMNIHMKDIGKAWDEEHVKKVLRLIDAYDARGHVYFMSSCGPLQDQLARLAPDIPRCMGNGRYDMGRPDIVDMAIKHKCQMVQLFKPYFDQSTIDRAHTAGMRVNVFWSDDPAEAKKFLEMGIDTILTNDYLLIANATGLK
jgi:glycerophosphoryl diester phosphodiesterase